jgi:glutamate N-acetyltransferase/amino-acid N-acetyltransferase
MSEASNWVIPLGFRVAGISAGIKPSGDRDLAVVVADSECAAAGVFTTNRIAAAPVRWDRQRVPSESIRAVVANSGNANAATGAVGAENVRRTAAAAASALGCKPEQIIVCSTGIIGRQLPIERLEAGVKKAISGLSADPSAFESASRAIMTTDTRPKVVSLNGKVGGSDCAIWGMAKGAAMIGPNMATMLAFLLTDRRVAAADLQKVLASAVDESFHCISVEGHMSTNDSVVLLASGASSVPRLEGSALADFAGLVRDACQSLARKIPEDGEGATHLITIDVEGCRDREEARTIARAVAESPLAKISIGGNDPNWGRIVSAAGSAGIPFEQDELSLTLNGVPVFVDGGPVPFDYAGLSERIKAEHETTCRLTLKRGTGKIRFWTCDMTATYIRLNGDFTT